MARKRRSYKSKPKYNSKTKAKQTKKILSEEYDDKMAASMLQEFASGEVLNATDLNESFNYFMLKSAESTKKPTKKKKGKRK